MASERLRAAAEAELAAAAALHAELATRCGAEIAELAAEILAVLARGGTIFWIGNGGSAAEAQHAAAELMGRFRRNRRPLRSLTLTVDTSALTAIANDYGYEEVFARQLSGLGRRGDLLVALSTSGNSPNVLRAVATARELGLRSAALTGADGGRLASLADLALRVPSTDTARIQEGHLVLLHVVCELVENLLGEIPA